MTDTITAFERLVRTFKLMIYAGVVFILLGVGISFAFGGAAKYFVISGSIGGGGLTIFVGIREYIRGKAVLNQTRSERFED